ncbi:E3 ubiquitin-protein ligase TRIM50-like, partial [Diadema antillarum]|uniref:E3 ubiquitin-protein ligase TRIM50-like n=1 Tax=Diadema antillarum TaxID=105358 RepID=UPI003A86D0FD
MAAEDPIDALEKELQCSVCQESYEDPRLLSCQHFFCRKCVQNLWLTSGRRTCIRCPLCRRETQLPNGHVENLRKNVFAGRVVDIIATIDLEKNRSKQLRCERRGCTAESNGTAVFYCESCQETVCASCGMKHHRNARQHNIKDIGEAVKEKRGKLSDLWQWGKNLETKLFENRDFIVTKQHEITRLFEAMRIDMSAATLEKMQCLQQQEKHMKEIIDVMERDIKGKVDREMAVNVKTSIADLQSLNNRSETLINKGGNASILANYRKT